MKAYTEFENAQEIRDYLNNLHGVTTEMEAKVANNEWYAVLSADVQNMLRCPMLGPFKVRVPYIVTPAPVASVAPVPGEPHAELRKQYEEDCKWYNELWKFWDVKCGIQAKWNRMHVKPLWYVNQDYRRNEPTIAMPDGTVLPRPVDKAKTSALYSSLLDRYYRTREDRVKAEDYLQRIRFLIRGEK